MMIRPARPQDLDAVAASYDALLDWEDAHGSHSNWQRGLYPTRSTAADALSRGTLFVLEDEGGAVCASMILNHDQAEDYRRIPWQYPASEREVLVLHTLCVPPAQAGRGYGRRMTTFYEEEALRQGCRVLRLDTWAENAPAAGLYTSLGFRLAGRAKVLHQGVIPEELVFFEKRL